MASRLASEVERVARLGPGSCAARDAAVRFRADVIARIGRIPARYREPLLSAANDLAERLTPCGSGRNGSEMQKKPSPPGAGIPHFRDPRRQAAAVAAWLRRNSR
jgi:hypothetical protein